MPSTLYKSSYKRPNRRDLVKQLTERTRSASRTKKSNDYGNYAHILQPLTSHQITQRSNLVPRPTAAQPYMQPTQAALYKSHSEHNLAKHVKQIDTMPKRSASKLQQSQTALPSRRNSMAQTSKVDADANKWLNILNKVFDRLDSGVSDNRQNKTTGIAPVAQPTQPAVEQPTVTQATVQPTATATVEHIEPNIQPNLRTLKQRLHRSTAPLYTDHATVHIKRKPSTDWRSGRPNPSGVPTEQTADVYWWPADKLSPEKPSKAFLEEQILLHKQTNASIPKLHQKAYDAAVQAQQPAPAAQPYKPTLAVVSNVVHHDIVAPPVSIETQTDLPYALPQPSNAFVKQPKLRRSASAAAAPVPSGSLAEVAFSQPRPYPRLSYSLAGVNKPATVDDKPKPHKKQFAVKSVVRQQIDADRQLYNTKMQHRKAATGVELPSRVSKANISSMLDSLYSDPILNAFMQRHNNNDTAAAAEHKYTAPHTFVPSVVVEPSYSRVPSTDAPSSHMSAADILALHDELLNSGTSASHSHNVQHTHFSDITNTPYQPLPRRAHSRTHSAQINYTPSTAHSKAGTPQQVPQYQSSVSSLSDDSLSQLSDNRSARSINTRNTATAQSIQSHLMSDTPQSSEFSSADEDTDISSVVTNNDRPQQVSSIATSLLSTPAELHDDDEQTQ